MKCIDLCSFQQKKWLELNNELEKRKEKYIWIIWAAFSIADYYEDWTACQVLFPHAKALLSCRPVESEHLVLWSQALCKIGYYAASQGNYLTAEEMSRRALEVREKALGEKHPDTLISVNDVAAVLRHQAKYEAAENMSRRVLEAREKLLGEKHPHTLKSMNNLALALRCQKKYKEAEEMNRRALEGGPKAWGKEHP